MESCPLESVNVVYPRSVGDRYIGARGTSIAVRQNALAAVRAASLSSQLLPFARSAVALSVVSRVSRVAREREHEFGRSKATRASRAEPVVGIQIATRSVLVCGDWRDSSSGEDWDVQATTDLRGQRPACPEAIFHTAYCARLCSSDRDAARRTWSVVTLRWILRVLWRTDPVARRTTFRRPRLREQLA